VRTFGSVIFPLLDTVEFITGKVRKSIGFFFIVSLALVVQTFYDAAVEGFFGSEELGGSTPRWPKQGLATFFMFDARAHDLLAPIIKEFGRPRR